MINEIGTLRTLPNGESLFVGSSSGVFFINTVRRAFSHAATASRHRSPQAHIDSQPSNLPSPEECIFGTAPQAENGLSDSENVDDIGELPNHTEAKELLVTYFRVWHPLLPFLHGPTCLKELEIYYSEVGAEGLPRKPRVLSTAIMFQCLFNIAKLNRPDLPPLGRSRVRSEEKLLSELSKLALKRDLASIQALLAAQLYFVATMSLQAASTTGGLLMQSVFKSGLHRCPYRYSNISNGDKEMRKRVFWSVYTLDRYTSQSLGYPLGIQDSDIDVCLPGKTELHKAVPTTHSEEGTAREEAVFHLPANHPQRQDAAQYRPKPPNTFNDEELGHGQDDEHSAASCSSHSGEANTRSQQRQQNQSVQAHFVRYSGLVGRVLEMFHKSIHARSTSRQQILFLKADIDAWGNEMPYASLLGSIDQSTSTDPEGLNYDVFFTIARQQLLLLVNRPSLSLEPSSAEFHHAIQVCIGAARSIIRTLEVSQQMLFWPGFMSAVWMSGLVLVFACQAKLHSIQNATNDVSASLRLIKSMTGRWSMAQNCHDVLTLLLENIRHPEASKDPLGTAMNQDEANSLLFQQEQHLSRGEKRAREEFSRDQPLESVHRRVRGCRRNGQSADSLPARNIGSSEQHLTTTRIGPTGNIATMYQDDTGYTNMNGQAMGLTTNMGQFHFPAQQQPECLANMQTPTSTWPSNYQFEQSYMGHSSTSNNPRSNELNVSMSATPGLDSISFYDVFDGATWGPLLDLVEPNG